MLRLIDRWHGLLVPAVSLLLPAFVTAISACDSSDDDPPPVFAIRPVVARFAPGTGTDAGSLPAFLDVPFPSDAYMDAQTRRFVKIPVLENTFKRGTDLLNGQMQKLNGWSRIAPAMFLIDDATAPLRDTETKERGSAIIDRESLPADEKACMSDASSVFLLDLDASVRVPCRAFFHDESEVDGGRSVLVVGPARGVVLKEGGHYLAVLTNRVKDKNGRTVFASKDFEATAIRKEGPLGALYGAAYDKALSMIGGGLGADAIVSLAPYTTQTVTSEIYAIRDALESAPPLVLKWDSAFLAPMGASKFASTAAGPLPQGFTASLDDWLGVLAQPQKLPDGSDDPDEDIPVRAHDKIAAIGTAAFEGTNFLQVKSSKYDDVEHATFARDGSGKPIPAPEKPTNKIWITIATPTAPMPPAGYPVVIIQHGLSGSRQYMMATANRFCSRGWMAVAIDSVTFGPRAPDPKYAVDTGTDYAAAPGVKYTGPDGISDAIVIGNAPPARAGSFEFFGGLKNIGSLRDQLRQAEIDTAQVVKLLRSSPDLAPLAMGSPLVTPKIDPEKIAYVGDSLGGIEGTVAAAIEPHVKAWVLNVAGGGILTEIGAHGPAINAQLSLAGALNFGFVGGQYNEGHPVVVIGQALAEGGDPIAYADKLVMNPMPLAGAPTKPRNILQIEVLYDELVANEGNEALARAAGYGMAMPNAGPNAALANLGTRSAFRGGGIEMTMLPLDPNGGGFHDTPVPGVTALLAQVAPGSHGADLVRSKGGRSYKIPFNSVDGRLNLDRIDEKRVPCPYRELQETMLRFFSDAFEGKVPVVTGLPAPIRDLDGDGVLDDADRDPVDLGIK
jgi:dienelactone hydrolase